MKQIECAAVLWVATEPQSRTTKTGKAWVSFTGRTGDGDEATWAQVSVFGDKATILAERLKKGMSVYVEGSIKLGSWTGSDGERKHGLNISSFDARILGEIGERKPKAPPKAAAAKAKPDSRPAGNGGRTYEAYDDEIPF